MRRTASEVIRSLEMRVARLERQATTKQVPTAQEVYDFLRGSSTGLGGRMKGLELSGRGDYWFLFIEPMNRERLDHYVGAYYDCDDDDEDCDPEGWDEDGWWEEWASPLTKELEALLTKKFPVFQKLKGGYGSDYTISIGEKGHIEIHLSKTKFKGE